MNYERVYYKFLEYFQQTDYRSRMERRDQNDFRLENDKIYTENHHIIPKFEGGNNELENFVKLLPEEHLFIHKIRIKAFKLYGDYHAVKMIINGCENKLKEYPTRITKNIKKEFIFLKHARFILRDGDYHSEAGRKSISTARKGKMPCIDSKTREPVGSIEIDHPNVLDGTWVHQTTGTLTAIIKETNEKVRISTKEYSENRHLYKSMITQKGQNNVKFSGFSDEDLVKICLNFYISYGSMNWRAFYESVKDIKYPNICKGSFRFSGRGKVGLVEEMEKILGTKLIFSGKTIKKVKND